MEVASTHGSKDDILKCLRCLRYLGTTILQYWLSMRVGFDLAFLITCSKLFGFHMARLSAGSEWPRQRLDRYRRSILASLNSSHFKTSKR